MKAFLRKFELLSFGKISNKLCSNLSTISCVLCFIKYLSLDSYNIHSSGSICPAEAAPLRQYRQHEVPQKSHQHILLGYSIISSKPKYCNEMMRKRGVRDVSEEILSLFVASRFQDSSTKPCPNEKPINQRGTFCGLCGRADSESYFRTREKSLIHTNPLTSFLGKRVDCTSCFGYYKSCKSAKGMSFSKLSLARSVSMIP